MISPSSGIPPVDVLPAIKHTTSIADEACRAVGDASIGVSPVLPRTLLARTHAYDSPLGMPGEHRLQLSTLPLVRNC